MSVILRNIFSLRFAHNRSQVNIKQLSLDENQLESINTIYRAKREVSLTFSEGEDGQRYAKHFTQQHGLDRAARESLDSRWNVQWSTSWPLGPIGDRRRRALVQWYMPQFVPFTSSQCSFLLLQRVGFQFNC